MGLLDIYNDYLKRMRNIEPADDFSGMNTDLMPPQTDDRGVVLGGDQRTESPLIKNPMFPGLPVGKSQTTSQQEMPNPRDRQKTSMQNMGLANDQDFLQKMSSLAGIDFSKASASWKDKGGFEGLMANPAFTLGLAFMQAGAEGKTIGKAGLDSVLKAGAISQNYKKLIQSRTEVLEVTASDIADMKAELDNYNVSDPNVFEQLFGKVTGKDPQKAFDKAAEMVALEYKKEVRKRAKAAGKKGQDFVVDSTLRKKIIDDIIKSGKVKLKKGVPLITKGTLEAPEETYELQQREHGGPVHSGESYLVGEKGPEVFIPKETGEVVANDDTQVFSMLLAANPQLQKVSRARSEKILRNRFPEYFE